MAIGLVLFPPNCQINGFYEELRVQYSRPQPYSGLTLPQLGLRGQPHAPATQGDPIAAPKQPEIHLKQQSN